MRLRTIVDLQSLLDTERAWRLKEIADLKITVRGSEVIRRDTLIRAGIALLYAHWEGFTKNAIGAYIDFVNEQNHRYEELATCFIALGTKRRLSDLTESNTSKANVEAIEFIRAHLSKTAQLPKGSTVNAKSNLNSIVFANLMSTIGLSPKDYVARYNLIDRELLKKRNAIAHGSYVDLDPTSFRVLADDVLKLINDVKTDIENAATLKAYKR